MINGVGSTSYDKLYQTNDKKTTNDKSEKAAKDESGVVVDIGKTETKNATYSKPAAKGLSSDEIDRLWAETNRATEHLKDLVEKLLLRQGKKAEDMLSGKDTLNVDSQAASEAQAMISEDGEFGVKAVAKRIVDFAKSLSGGDKSKLEELKKGIELGFKQAEAAFGGKLPDICNQTHDEIMKELDNWAKE